MLLPLLEASEPVSENPPFNAIDPLNQLTNGWLGEFNIWTILIR